MKKLLSILFAAALTFSIIVIGNISAGATSMGAIGQVKYIKRKSRKVYHRTKHGSKVVYYKTKRGTKKTYHKSKRVTKRTYSKTKDKVTN